MATWRSALCVHTHTHTRTSYQLRLSPVAPLSQHTIRENVSETNCLRPQVNSPESKISPEDWKRVFSGKLFCVVLCAVTVEEVFNRHSDNTHKKPLSKIYMIQAHEHFTECYIVSTLHHLLLHPKTYMRCCILSFG